VRLSADSAAPPGEHNVRLVAEADGVRATADLRVVVTPKQRPDPLGMKFVKLPKGTFYMGWQGKDTAGKQTEISQDFEIAARTVTQAEWQALMKDNPAWFSRDGGGKDDVKDVSADDLGQFPVENVSWDMALEFAKKLNEKERGAGWVYRLPTEAEWEYACRAGATSEADCSFHFYFAQPTNDLSSDQANFNGNFPDGNAPKGAYLMRPTKVGSYPPNTLGLFDMHGNVWQWCDDLWASGGSNRVIRGGSWADNGTCCRAAYRGPAAASSRFHDVGLRLVRVPSGGK
jgi:formylglycine-generating enzyme required for sulfatase activity